MRWPRAIDIVDVFAYTIVLGLFVQFFPQVISESFLLSLLTALLLKVVLEAVVWLKALLLRRLKAASSIRQRIVRLAALLIVLPGSKFVVLELTAIVFRGHVYLGGFFAVTALIIVLMLARGGARRLLTPRTKALSENNPSRSEPGE